MTPAEPASAPANTASENAAPAQPSPTITSIAEYEAVGIELMDGLLAVFQAGGTNCDKLAVDIDAFLTASTPRIKAVNEYEEAHDDARAAFDAKLETRAEAINNALMTAIGACKEHAGFNQSMDRMETM